MHIETDTEQHLEKFARSFIHERSRSRYLQLAKTERGRRTFASSAHKLFAEIDLKYATNAFDLFPPGSSEDSIAAHFTTQWNVDPNAMVLYGIHFEEFRNVIHFIQYGLDGIISIIPGRLAYFGHEDTSDRWILEKRIGDPRPILRNRK